MQELNPDIVVLDLAMPGMNGFEVAREIAAIALPHEDDNVHGQRLGGTCTRGSECGHQ